MDLLELMSSPVLTPIKPCSRSTSPGVSDATTISDCTCAGPTAHLFHAHKKLNFDGLAAAKYRCEAESAIARARGPADRLAAVNAVARRLVPLAPGRFAVVVPCASVNA